MADCLIALGSNLGRRSVALRRAVAKLDENSDVRIIAISNWHRTAAVGGPGGQDRFVNGAVRIETSLSATSLFALIQQIESELGRERHERWADRAIDLDLLLYDDQTIESDDLIVPHPRMAFRRFVLDSAAEVAADMRHPTIGWTVGQLLEHLNSAANYVAITGTPMDEQAKLARRLSEEFGGRLLTDTPPERASAVVRGQPPDTNMEFDANLEYDPDLEVLERRAGLLGQIDPPAANSSDNWLLVSDFWLGESLAVAELCQDATKREMLSARSADLRSAVITPKLIIVLDQAASNPRETPGSWPFDPWQQALHTVIGRGGHGPVLRLDANDATLVWQEASAAVCAMR